MSRRSSHSDPALLEPSAPKPPVQAPKPVLGTVPDLESVSISVISDASEFDNNYYPNGFQSEAFGNYPPYTSSSIPPYSHVNAQRTSNIPPEHIHGTSPQTKMPNPVSPTAYQFGGHLPYYMFQTKNNYGPCAANSPYLSNNRDVYGARDNFEKASGLFNESHSVSLRPQQLQYQESSAIVNNSDSIILKKSESGSSKSTEKENVPSEVWTLLQEQNEMIKQLQNQLSTLQQQNSSATLSKQETTPFSEDKKLEAINESLNSILRYVSEHNNTILTLKDQVSMLAKRTDELESSNRHNRSEPLGFSKANKSSSSAGVMCHSETSVKKVSSSTMTSVTMGSNEKLLYSKTTVVTENSKKGSLVPHTPAKGTPANLNSSHCNGCNCERSSDSKKTKEKVKAGRGCENLTPVDLVSPTTLKSRASNHNNSFPLCTTNQGNKNKTIRQSPQERSIPNYDNIVQNIDNLVLRDGECAEPSGKYCCSCQCKENKSSGASSAKRKSRVQKCSGACASSNTSEDSDYGSPNKGLIDDSERDSDNKNFGLPQCLLSVNTRQYLEKYNLYDLGRKSSKKSNSEHLKQHFR